MKNQQKFAIGKGVTHGLPWKNKQINGDLAILEFFDTDDNVIMVSVILIAINTIVYI